MYYPRAYCYLHIIDLNLILPASIFGLESLIISFLVFMNDFKTTPKSKFREFTANRLILFSLGLLVFGITLYLVIRSDCYHRISFSFHIVPYFVFLFSLVIPLIVIILRRRFMRDE